jgi:acetyl esterase/lipase
MKIAFLKFTSGVILSSKAPFNFLMAHFIGVAVKKNVPYGHGSKKRLDIYGQRSGHKSSTSLQPVIIDVHGGGWVIGDKKGEAKLCSNLAGQGYIVCSINYSLAPKNSFPVAIADCLEATTWVCQNIESYGGDPKRIYILGGSAGAHIASFAIALVKSRKRLTDLSYKLDASSVKGMILYYGVYDLRSFLSIKRRFLLTYLQCLINTKDFKNSKLLDEASPINYISREFPPTLLLAGECDPLTPQTLEFSRKLKDNNVKTKTVIYKESDYPDASHGFQGKLRTGAGKDAFSQVLVFLSRLN